MTAQKQRYMILESTSNQINLNDDLQYIVWSDGEVHEISTARGYAFIWPNRLSVETLKKFKKGYSYHWWSTSIQSEHLDEESGAALCIQEFIDESFNQPIPNAQTEKLTVFNRTVTENGSVIEKEMCPDCNEQIRWIELYRKCPNCRRLYE
jgi:hypothetical protein